MADPDAIPGWNDLVAWFGRAPDFHDAEVLSLALRRLPAPSLLRVHTWLTGPGVDAAGYLVHDRPVIVRFVLASISRLELSEWSPQNVLLGLTIAADEPGWRIQLDPSYGLGGSIVAGSLQIELEPISGAETDG